MRNPPGESLARAENQDSIKRSVIGDLYKGNLQNVGMALSATTVSCVAGALAAWAESTAGGSAAASATAAWLASYVWYPG